MEFVAPFIVNRIAGGDEAFEFELRRSCPAVESAGIAQGLLEVTDYGQHIWRIRFAQVQAVQ